MTLTEELLEEAPFVKTQKEKETLFQAALFEAHAVHVKSSEAYRKLVENLGRNINETSPIEDYPYLPVNIFKELDLISVPEGKISARIHSSATTGAKKSVIALDKITSDRQRRALVNIMGDFIGGRKSFVVVDAETTVKAAGKNISSRASAIRGMMPLAKNMSFILDDTLQALEEKTSKALAQEEVCFFGFTWLIYKTIQDLKKTGQDKKFSELFSQRPGSYVLHIGGWKKLKDLAVEKEQFNKELATFFYTEPDKIIDFYGMTEQLGTVYPDCSSGHKHASLYSEIIIRDQETLEPLAPGNEGFIQLLSPIPHSYPGISLLTDDIGEIQGIDDCPCGRKGKYFVFKKRSEKAEIKGCGDTLG